MLRIVNETHVQDLANFTQPDAWSVWKVGSKIWCELEITEVNGFETLVRLIKNEGESGAIDGAKYLGFQFTNIGIPGRAGHLVNKHDIVSRLREQFDDMIKELEK